MSTSNQLPITANVLLAAYASGYFPMAEHQDAQELHWYDPEVRGVLPLDKYHVPKSLRRFLRRYPFHFTVNQAFPDVIRACAEPTLARPSTWINAPIISLYSELWHLGHAHSVECWRDNALVGGLYGVSLGGAFFGESMFSKETNASKSALAYLLKRLHERGFVLLDTQFINAHLKQFGAIEIPRAEYQRQLKHALTLKDVSFADQA